MQVCSRFTGDLSLFEIDPKSSGRRRDGSEFRAMALRFLVRRRMAKLKKKAFRPDRLFDVLESNRSLLQSIQPGSLMV